MSTSKTSKKPVISNININKKSLLLLMKDNHDVQNFDIIHLRHPGSNQKSMFSLIGDSIQEIMTFSEKNRSWFIDDSVLSDGKLFLSTPIDPIFLVLPYLKKNCSNNAMSLNQALVDEDFPENNRLLDCSGLKFLHVVSDKKGVETLNAYKYNEEKTLSWLKKKTEKISEILKKKNVHVGSGAISATFVKSEVLSDSKDELAYIKYAHGIISEYLSEELCKKLSNHLGLPEETNKRKNGPTPQKIQMKKVKTEESSDLVNITLDLNKSEKHKMQPMSAKKKALAKAATGSKTISSFFIKK